MYIQTTSLSVFKMKTIISLAIACLLLVSTSVAQELKSPDGKLIMNFSLVENGKPSYTLTYKGKLVIKPSKLGLELKQEGTGGFAGDMQQKTANLKASLYDNFTVADIKAISFDETWAPVWGEVVAAMPSVLQRRIKMPPKDSRG